MKDSHILVLLTFVVGAAALLFIPSGRPAQKFFANSRELGMAVLDILPNEEKCFPIFLLQDMSALDFKELVELRLSFGTGVFEAIEGSQSINTTQAQLSRTINLARQLRLASWCVMVVVVSDDPGFLATFATYSLQGRLLVWSTRLLVVTSLNQEKLKTLAASHWTFSMTNTMMLNVISISKITRYNVYVHMPFTPNGAQGKQIAFWNAGRGLQKLIGLNIFPDKYLSFHGAVLDTTVLEWEPYWKITTEDNVTSYSGMDVELLVTMREVLNFTFRILPSATWDDVTDQTASRRAFFTSIVYSVLPNRYEQYDFTRVITMTELLFAMAKPVVTPNWLNFYYPLGGQVWVAVLASTIFVCASMVMITRTERWQIRHGRLSTEAVLLEAVGSLLGQGHYGRISSSSSNHILAGCWLFFGVIISTAYRGSLIASLTLPRQPARPETVEDLVTSVERVTYESYGSSHKEFLLKSESPTYQTLGDMIYIGVDIMDGLRDALRKKMAHMDTRQYLQLMIAKHFTEVDGTSPIYIGKSAVITYSLAWPIPHDAPYKHALDKVITSIVEGGLYDQWRKRTLNKVTRESQLQKIKVSGSQNRKQDGVSESTEQQIKSLTIIHVQGPLLLLLIGLAVAGVSLAVEKFLFHQQM